METARPVHRCLLLGLLLGLLAIVQGFPSGLRSADQSSLLQEANVAQEQGDAVQDLDAGEASLIDEEYEEDAEGDMAEEDEEHEEDAEGDMAEEDEEYEEDAEGDMAEENEEGEDDADQPSLLQVVKSSNEEPDARAAGLTAVQEEGVAAQEYAAQDLDAGEASLIDEELSAGDDEAVEEEDVEGDMAEEDEEHKEEAETIQDMNDLDAEAVEGIWPAMDEGEGPLEHVEEDQEDQFDQVPQEKADSAAALVQEDADPSRHPVIDDPEQEEPKQEDFLDFDFTFKGKKCWWKKGHCGQTLYVDLDEVSFKGCRAACEHTYNCQGITWFNPKKKKGCRLSLEQVRSIDCIECVRKNATFRGYYHEHGHDHEGHDHHISDGYGYHSAKAKH